eukprot:6205686-Pleurochrysis_carterae.AAC.6
MFTMRAILADLLQQRAQRVLHHRRAVGVGSGHKAIESAACTAASAACTACTAECGTFSARYGCWLCSRLACDCRR